MMESIASMSMSMSAASFATNYSLAVTKNRNSCRNGW